MDNNYSERVEEEKRWLISRVELFHKSILEENRIAIQLWNNVAQKEITRVKGRRNNILSGLGVALTILLGLNAVTEVDQIHFFLFLFLILVIGLVTYIGFNLIMVREEGIFNFIMGSVLDSDEKVSFSFGFFIARTMILSNVTYQYVFNYFIFMNLLNASLMEAGSKIIKKCHEDKFLNPDIKNELQIDTTSFEQIMKNVPDYLKQLDRSQFLPKKLLDFIDDTLAGYKPKDEVTTNG